ASRRRLARRRAQAQELLERPAGCRARRRARAGSGRPARPRLRGSGRARRRRRRTAASEPPAATATAATTGGLRAGTATDRREDLLQQRLERQAALLRDQAPGRSLATL